jgi:signal transduction histidine kinase
MDPFQSKIYTAVLITSVILGTIIFYFAISMARHQRRMLQLQRMNILAEINAIEKERTRMAQDLHDELGPTLTVVKFEVDSAEAKTAEDQELLQKASGQLNDAVNKIREIARNMMPSSLTRKGLEAALNEIVNHTNEFTKLHLSFTYEVTSKIDEERSINIYRILQEVVQNAVKYSQAELMIIKIREENGILNILCEDNGVGFDYDSMIESGEGLGLRNFRSRTDLMKGRLNVASQIGKGTQYIFEIPLSF